MMLLLVFNAANFAKSHSTETIRTKNCCRPLDSWNSSWISLRFMFQWNQCTLTMCWSASDLWHLHTKCMRALCATFLIIYVHKITTCTCCSVAQCLVLCCVVINTLPKWRRTFAWIEWEPQSHTASHLVQRIHYNCHQCAWLACASVWGGIQTLFYSIFTIHKF